MCTDSYYCFNKYFQNHHLQSRPGYNTRDHELLAMSDENKILIDKFMLERYRKYKFCVFIDLRYKIKVYKIKFPTCIHVVKMMVKRTHKSFNKSVNITKNSRIRIVSKCNLLQITPFSAETFNHRVPHVNNDDVNFLYIFHNKVACDYGGFPLTQTYILHYQDTTSMNPP